MGNDYESIKKKNIVIWGTGRIMRRDFPRISDELSISGFTTSFCEQRVDDYFEGLPLIPKEEIKEDNGIIIAIQNEDDVNVVEHYLNERRVNHCMINDAVIANSREWEKTQICQCRSSVKREFSYNIDSDNIASYISLHIPNNFCNLRCSYCYIRQVTDFKSKRTYIPSPEFIRCAFSVERVGGVSLFNICAKGETLLLDEVVDLIDALTSMGHFVSIVTNGTISKAFEKFNKIGTDLTRCFFKFSYHYKEFKTKSLLDKFWENVHFVEVKGASYTIELVASDDNVELIEEIKADCLREAGALPHVTIPRDDNTPEKAVLTEYSIDEYQRIWKEFESELFDYKLEILSDKRKEYCYAGDWSFLINISNGDVCQCLSCPPYTNAYSDLNEQIQVKRIEDKCELPYCYNGHAYFSLGIVPEVDAPSYYLMRNRKTSNGKEWVSGNIKNAFSKRICDIRLDNE